MAKEKTLKQRHLRMILPWLSRKFRSITKTEAKQKKVFTEFFGDETFKVWKLKAIFEYQKDDNI